VWAPETPRRYPTPLTYCPFLLLLCRQLHNDDHVTFAGYKVPHPLEYQMLIKVQTNGTKTPIKAAHDAIWALEQEVGDMAEQFKVGGCVQVYGWVPLTLAKNNPSSTLVQPHSSAPKLYWAPSLLLMRVQREVMRVTGGADEQQQQQRQFR
jgi:hypothetical protein